MCNLLIFDNVDFKAFCGLISHYQNVGIDPALIVNVSEAIFVPSFATALAVQNLKLESTGEVYQIAAIRYRQSDIELHWFSSAKVVKVFRITNQAPERLERVFLKTANKPINAIGIY